MTTPGTPYFELAKRIEIEHLARAGNESVYVVPVLVGDLDRGQIIVAECLSSLLGGTVLGASVAPDLFQPRAGHPYTVMRSAVEQSLDLHYPSSRNRVQVYVDPGLDAPSGGPGPHYQLALLSESSVQDGQTQAPTEGDAGGTEQSLPLGSLSGGQQAMVGLAASLLDAALINGELAVVLYDETGMDSTAVRACWSLIVDQLPGMTLAPLRTIVVLVGTTPSISVHAAPGRGCRYAITGNRLLERKPLDSARGEARAFATREAKARVLFLGAGFSASSRLPLGNALRDSALQRLVGLSSLAEVAGSRDLAKRFRAVPVADQALPSSMSHLTEDEFADQLTLEHVLPFELEKYAGLPTLAEFAQAHERAKAAPGAAVLSLADLLRSPKRLILVTVNFDELVEFVAPTGVRVFATDSEFAEAADYISDYLAGSAVAVPYLKLHGTIGVPESCVVTTTQTEQGISAARQAALESLLPDDDTRIPWTYVGASMRDADLRPCLQHARFGVRLDERWVAPFSDVAVEVFAETRRPHWGGSNLQSRLITETADSFLELLVEAWQL